MSAQIIVQFDSFTAARPVRGTRRRDGARSARLAQDTWQSLADLADDIDGNVADLLEGIVFDTLLPTVDFSIPKAA